MIFKQVFDTKSSTYTYLIASAKGREALMIDPVIENVDSYIRLLKELDLKLVIKIYTRHTVIIIAIISKKTLGNL